VACRCEILEAPIFAVLAVTAQDFVVGNFLTMLGVTLIFATALPMPCWRKGGSTVSGPSSKAGVS
jgi:hypothetical protein